eukprot:TRINITY_DN5820_c0_g1_i1.p3 TRINITY_DN5820_c0_g1~~TRINITY_DN5820_c0_g1_i1.p3  ORF type:complete len:129 (+),score=42.79 TRINITY_DN5820_c0_g1_i1:67-453(+)
MSLNDVGKYQLDCTFCCTICEDPNATYCGACGNALIPLDKRVTCKSCAAVSKKGTRYCGCCGLDLGRAVLYVKTQDTRLVKAVRDIFPEYKVETEYIPRTALPPKPAEPPPGQKRRVHNESMHKRDWR